MRVLCYHSIADLAGDPVLEPYGVPRPEFRRHLELLDRHFCLIGPDEFFRYLKGTGGVPRRAVLLTFDDCYTDLVTAALPELRARNASALAFVVTGPRGRDERLGMRISAPARSRSSTRTDWRH